MVDISWDADDCKYASGMMSHMLKSGYSSESACLRLE